MSIKKLIFFAFVITFCLSCYSQSKLPSNEKDEIQPENLADAILFLDADLPLSMKQEIKRASRDDLAKYHFSLGLTVRNQWKLGRDTSLSAWFKKNGIYGADDMSHIIIDMYWKYLNSLPLSLKKSVADLREAYEELGKQIDSSGVVVKEGDELVPLPDPANVKEDIVKLN